MGRKLHPARRRPGGGPFSSGFVRTHHTGGMVETLERRSDTMVAAGGVQVLTQME
jgi:hypothetical protein